MTAGRCAGCGFTNASHKQVNEHIWDCPRWIELFRKHPTAALDAEAEYRRWQAEDKDADRVARKDAAVAVTDARRAAQDKRFATPPDILED